MTGSYVIQIPNPKSQIPNRNRLRFDLGFGFWDLGFGIYTCGPAALTGGATSFSNVLKFSMNMPASFLACSSYAFLSGHVLPGSRTLSGTPGHIAGISRLKIACL